MPYVMTKYLFAQRVLKILNSKLPDIQLKEDYFLWGVQGADILYDNDYDECEDSVKQLRFALDHHHICDVFANFNKFSKQYSTYEKAAESYALGYMCYYCLSRRTNPFVFAMASDYAIAFNLDFDSEQQALLSRVSSQLDCYIVNAEYGDESSDPSAAFAGYDSAGKFLSTLYSDLASELFDIHISEDELRTAIVSSVNHSIAAYSRDFSSRLSDWLDYTRGFLMGNRSGYLTKSVPNKLLKDYDYANSQNSEWLDMFDPHRQPHTDSYKNIFDNAVKESARLCAGYLLYENDRIDICDVTECLSIVTGQPMKRSYDMSDYAVGV